MRGFISESAVVPDAEPVGGAGAEVLDHDVGGAGEVVEDLARLRALEVERHAQLVAPALEHRDRQVAGVLARQVEPARSDVRRVVARGIARRPGSRP